MCQAVSTIENPSPLESGGTCTIGTTVRNLLAQRIGQDRLDLWFGRAARWDFDNNVLTIGLESPFLVDCVRSLCWDELRSVVEELGDDRTAIRLQHVAVPRTVTPSKPSPPVRSAAQVPMKPPAVETDRLPNFGFARSDSSDADAPRKLAPIPKVEEADLWSDFVQGSGSRLATTAVEMIFERPGTLSPVLIYGPSGSGKSHLARAIGQQLRRRCGMRRTIIMTGEQFTIDFTESARGAGFASFRQKYRDVDAFILDDLHFCLGKHATLSELRNTIDNLLRDRRQVVLVSDRSLNELTGLGSDLHARIAGGMTCGIEPLDSETRRQLLVKLLVKHQVLLNEGTTHALAEAAGGDGRAIFGIVFRLLTEQRKLGRPLTHDDAVAASLDLIRACQPVVRLSDIERAVCENFRLDPKSLQTKGKTKFVSGPRMLAMFLARKHTRAAYAEIGEFFGNRQHSTVISAQRKVEQWIESNDALPHGMGSVRVREVLRNLESALQVG
ncbi:MAG: DnaA/Hda family protein [Pirellulaceae bacterium]|nr:DnaA/Hda family protein [Pirellulaceae bacterium]